MDPAQLKAQYDQTQYLADQHENINRDLLKGFSKAEIEMLKSQSGQTNHILDYQDRAQYANENRQNRNFTLLNDSIKDQGASTRDTVFRTTAAVTDNVVKGAADNLLATEKIATHIDDNIYRTSAALDQSVYRSQTSLGSQISQIGLEGQKMTNELIGYLKSNADQSWKNFADQTKDILNAKASMSLQSATQYANLMKAGSENTASIQIEALKNKSDLSKQMAFEYSDLKNSIATSESTIKQLLQSQESDRLRDALRTTEHKSLYFELKDRHHHHRRRH